MQNDGIDLIEKRIRDLELKVYGTHNVEATEANCSYKPIVQTLNEANTVLISKLSSRSQINELFRKFNLITKLFDPIFPEVLNENNAKMEIILQDEAKFKEVIKNLDDLQKLNYTLDKDLFLHIFSLQDKIRTLTEFILNNRELIFTQDKKVSYFINEYNKMLLFFTLSFAKIDAYITNLEKQKLKRRKEYN